jgi:tetratricopeptide (TPR) repeat protein
MYLGKYTEAMADCNKAIELDPKLSAAYDSRAQIHNRLGHYAEAIADCDKAIALNQKEAAAYNTRGYAYYKLGKTKINLRRAIADYDMAVQLMGNAYKPDFKYRNNAVAALNIATGP